ncbi:MAG TPA: Gfo/Idh/MocA family oxidoreductase [Lacunisphaera sp.]|nr:Gfo/Idh/MocA family oxidoreductase [Lacunisphaera sp.]
MKQQVRLGIVGYGGMGQYHARYLGEGRVKRVTLAAVADIDAKKLVTVAAGVRTFPDARSLLRSGAVDAVLIATPHYAHVEVGIAALRAGLHVLVEKPVAVDKAGAEHLIAAHTRRRQVFAVMFNQRTDPRYRHLRELLQRGDLGPVRRVAWTITDWFRPHAYYASGGWRATWAGEGGGVLVNQSPHYLDQLVWLFGAPVRVRAICRFGRYHPIEVEDDVVAQLEYADGSHATYTTSTGEAPGTNRLEVVADNGRVVIEAGRMQYLRNTVPASRFSRTTREFFAGGPPVREVKLKGLDGPGGQHAAITQNFVDAILDGAPLIAPAAEGLRPVELANAMLLSAWTNKAIELPLSGTLYRRWLRRKIAESGKAPGIRQIGLRV